MQAEQIISRLEFAKPIGRDKWIARCPAHDDRSPSLSVRQCDDGRVLINCFAGCGCVDVLAAIGLDQTALFPPDDNYTPEHKKALIERISVDLLVVEIWDAERAKNLPINPGDVERYELAISRLKKVAV